MVTEHAVFLMLIGILSKFKNNSNFSINLRAYSSLRPTGALRQVSNFSIGGFFIRTGHASSFKRGDKIELVTRLPLEKRIMLIKAQVAHVTNRGMGVQFLEVHGPCAQAIQSNFEVFRATVPLPAP